MNIRLFALAAIAFACAPDEGPVTARVGAAVFDGRASASYFADGRFFGFIASSEDRATQIEVRVEGIDAEEVGVFEVTPNTANEIRLSLGGTDRTGVGSIEVASFTLEIDQD